MTKKIGQFLGSIIDEVEEIDQRASWDCDGKFLRVRAVIDVERPRPGILRVDVLGDGVETVMLLRYERLPDHCFHCGRLGHKTRECIYFNDGQSENASLEFLCGAWLKAENPVTLSIQRDKPGSQSCGEVTDKGCTDGADCQVRTYMGGVEKGKELSLRIPRE
ncbi:hypothetical protein Ddye_016899 [Dipteronia dyeriana]|uniref:CCHC-type domain-containing protein n=1 Tax=Dipteronia dyeriana TaxID=168575 RepID=A0AAD9X101_9ROSI|nr:hypothetical protein Ddye_016899 [Dipteronia dyeriana]